MKRVDSLQFVRARLRQNHSPLHRELHLNPPERIRRRHAFALGQGRGQRLEYVDESGIASQESSRMVERSTLIWRTDAALYRLETDLPLEEAAAVAETLP